MTQEVENILGQLRGVYSALTNHPITARVGGLSKVPEAIIALLEEVSPSRDPIEVTPSDATTYSGMKGFRVGSAGDVVITKHDGTDITITGAVAGEHLPINCLKIKAATTATNIIAYF